MFHLGVSWDQAASPTGDKGHCQRDKVTTMVTTDVWRRARQSERRHHIKHFGGVRSPPESYSVINNLSAPLVTDRDRWSRTGRRLTSCCCVGFTLLFGSLQILKGSERSRTFAAEAVKAHKGFKKTYLRKLKLTSGPEGSGSHIYISAVFEGCVWSMKWQWFFLALLFGDKFAVSGGVRLNKVNNWALCTCWGPSEHSHCSTVDSDLSNNNQHRERPFANTDVWLLIFKQREGGCKTPKNKQTKKTTKSEFWLFSPNSDFNLRMLSFFFTRRDLNLHWDWVIGGATNVYQMCSWPIISIIPNGVSTATEIRWGTLKHCSFFPKSTTS